MGARPTKLNFREEQICIFTVYLEQYLQSLFGSFVSGY